MYNFIRNPTDGRASSLEMIKGYVVVGAQMRLTTLCKKGWDCLIPQGLGKTTTDPIILVSQAFSTGTFGFSSFSRTEP